MAFARHLWIPILALVSALSSAGCGYVLQNSHSELLDKEGIRKVYVKPLFNATYKPGVENVVYNALIRTILAHRRVKVVQHESDADAVLQGTVTQAQFASIAGAAASSLPPTLTAPIPGSGLDIGNITIASVYNATLGCSFSLVRTVNIPGKKALVWSGAFTRNEPFPASNQLDVPGTTSALINESEFERALSDMATNMMGDVHESMLAMF